MRIIAGEWGGRRLHGPGGHARPTQDRLRQILFDILGERVSRGPVLDLYAGSGALGLEALSRGAPRAVFVESARASQDSLVRNLADLGAGDRARVLGLPVMRALPLLEREGLAFAWILADPPYGDPEAPLLLEILGRPEGTLLPAGMGLVLETRRDDGPPEGSGFLRRTRVRVAGGTALHFYERGTHRWTEGRAS